MHGPQRRIPIGSSLEWVGAGLFCYGVDRLAGVGWSVLSAGVLLVVAAELIYDGHNLVFKLPRRPRPVARARSRVADWRARR